MVSTLVQNAIYAGSIPAIGTIFPIFISFMILVSMTRIPYELCAVWLLNLPCVYVCEVTACMYVIVSVKRLTIPEGTSVVVCTDVSGKKPHKQVGEGIVVTSGKPMLCNG